MRSEYDFSKGNRGAVIASPGKTRITIMLDDDIIELFRQKAARSLDEAQRNPGALDCNCASIDVRRNPIPDSAALHPGYSLLAIAPNVAHAVVGWR